MNGGAGIAAHRIHKSVRSSGVQSNMIVLEKEGDDPDISTFTPKDKLKYHERTTAFQQKLDWCSPALLPHYTQFSDDRLGFDISNHPLIQEADIIHLHWISQLVHFTSLFDAIRGKPIVWTLHDCYPFLDGWHLMIDKERFLTHHLGIRSQVHRCVMHRWLNGIERRKKKSYRGQCMHLVAPSRWMLRQATQSTLFAGRPISLIPHGVETDLFRPYDKEQVRCELGLPPDKTIFLFFSGLSFYNKGGPFLLEGLRLLSKQRDLSDSAIIIIGYNTFEKGEELGLEVISLASIHDDEKLIRYISAVDFSVIPSFEESFCLAALESMSCGTPVVGSSVGAIPDLIDDERDGMLCRTGSMGDFVTKIQWMLDHPLERERMGGLAREKVLEMYSMDMLGERYTDLYQTIGKRL